MAAGGLVTGLVAGILLLQPATAEAHTRTQETTNVVSRVTAAPLPDGVEFTVHTGGLLVEVVNRTTATLIVHGYDGEPYLRIGPAGVERNRRSPATYLNLERYGDVAIPRDVDAAARPEWIHLDARPHYLWHDHRTHWMSTGPPPFVEAGPLARLLMTTRLVGTIGTGGDRVESFNEWVVELTFEGRRIDVEGELVWEDPPSAVPWLLFASVLVAPALVGLRRMDLAALVRPAALMVGAVAAANSIHLVDDLVAWPGDPLDDLVGLLHTTIFLTGGIGGSLWALAVPTGRVLALGVASASVLYHQGLVHLPLLFASQFPSIWPQNLVRLTVALGLLQAVPVAIVIHRAMRNGTATAPRPARVAPVTASPSPRGGSPDTEVVGEAPGRTG